MKTSRRILVGITLGLLLTALVCGAAIASSPTSVLPGSFYQPIVETGKAPPGGSPTNVLPVSFYMPIVVKS